MLPKIEIVGDVEKIAQYIPWAKKQWVLRDGLWYKDLKECFIEFKNINNSGYVRIFVKAVNGFAIHPRSKLFVNGINTETALPISTTYPMFPLYDNDNGTMLLNVDEADKNPNEQNYGIAYWTDGDNSLSWRCLPELAFGVARDVAIEGITVFDVEVNGTKYHTPLSPYIYEQGEKIPTPGKMRAAAYLAGTLVCLCTVNYTQYDYTTTSGFPKNPVGTDGGYFDELYALTNSTNSLVNAFNAAGESVSGWERIGYRSSQVSNTPCWFSADGKILNENDVYWQIAKTEAGVVTAELVYRILPTNIFTLYTSPYWRQSANSTYQDFYTPSSSATIKQFLEDKTIVSQNYSELAKSIQRVFERRPDPTNYYIDITSYGNLVYRLTATGFKGSGEWNTGETDESILVDLSTECGVIEYSFRDICDFEATVILRANGSLQFDTQLGSGTCLNDSRYFYYDQNQEFDSLGALIYSETWYLQNSEDSTASCECSSCNGAACTPYLEKLDNIGTNTRKCYVPGTGCTVPSGTISCPIYRFLYVKDIYKWKC